MTGRAGDAIASAADQRAIHFPEYKRPSQVWGIPYRAPELTACSRAELHILLVQRPTTRERLCRDKKTLHPWILRKTRYILQWTKKEMIPMYRWRPELSGGCRPYHTFTNEKSTRYSWMDGGTLHILQYIYILRRICWEGYRLELKSFIKRCRTLMTA